MRPLLTFMSALAIAVTLMLPTTVTASAGDRSYGNLTVNVDYRRGGRRHFAERRYRGDRHYGRSYYRGRRHDGPSYRYSRRHRGPSVGIIIGGGVPYYRPAPRYIAPPVIQYRPAYGASTHVAWCHSRYRSYRAYDNTFQPYHGPRRICVSPY